jgi:hypothetical protein
VHYALASTDGPNISGRQCRQKAQSRVDRGFDTGINAILSMPNAENCGLNRLQQINQLYEAHKNATFKKE